MNAASLLLFPLASVGLLVSPPPLPQTESKEQLRAYLAQLDGETIAPAEPSAPMAKAATGALATSGLTPSRLQSSSGIQTGARGLTEAKEWQRIFPRYGAR